MDLSEFEHIFGASESAFVIWDTDNNGLIDSLELFSGICEFSETKFDDKIRCKYNLPTLIVLFDLFDFNELESLSPVDIEFMIYSCMSATFKIYSISTELNNDELSNFSLKYFGSDNRLTVVELIKFILKFKDYIGALNLRVKLTSSSILSVRIRMHTLGSRRLMKKVMKNYHKNNLTIDITVYHGFRYPTTDKVFLQTTPPITLTLTLISYYLL